MGVCNCSMFCCTLLYVRSSIAIILMGKRELIALLGLSSWCLVIVERLFLAVPLCCLQFVIVVFPDHTHLLFLQRLSAENKKKSKLVPSDPGDFPDLVKVVCFIRNFIIHFRESPCTIRDGLSRVDIIT